VSLWNQWRARTVVQKVASGRAQESVLVTVEYHVDADNANVFLRAMQKYGHVRRRGGASHWGVFHDLEHADRYLETFRVMSWAEQLRQHERLTDGDSELEQLVRSYIRGEPIVRHFVYAESER
jgi:poly(3-hydroxybutyrate) depolymerase